MSLSCETGGPMFRTLALLILAGVFVVGPGLFGMSAHAGAPDVSKMSEEEKKNLSDRQKRILRRQMASREKEAAAAYKNAETAFLVGQYDKAIEEFLAVAREHGDTSYRMRAVLRVGDVFYRQKKYERAISYYQRALRVPSEPWWPKESAEDYARADYMIGVCYYDQGSLNPAFAHFRRFVKKHPTSKLVDRAYDFIGRGNMRMERYGQAIEAFRMVGTARLEKKARRTISPGEDLYLRVTDEDVGLASKQGTIPVRLSTSSGDKERVELESLGLGSPTFLGTIKTRLGEPRLTRALDAAYTTKTGRKMDEWLETAKETRKEAQAVQKKVRAVEKQLEQARKGLKNEDGTENPEARQKVDALEKRKAELEKQVADLTEAADSLQKRAYTTLDEAYSDIEAVLKEWGVARIEDEEEGDETEEDSKTEEKTAEKTAKAAKKKDQGDKLSDVFTPLEIAETRNAVKETPTSEENFRFRRALMEYWHEQLLREYKTLDLTGSDTITVEYLDRHSGDEDNVTRTDTLGVASDARIVCLGPDLKSPVQAVIFGDNVRVKVVDADRDASDKPDTLHVVVASVPKEDEQQKEEDDEKGEETEEEESLSVDVTGGEEKEQKKPKLIPEDVPNTKVTLTETGKHTGEFIGSFSTLPRKENGTASELGLSVEQAVRIAYEDEKTSSYGKGGWVAVATVEIVPGSEGSQQVIKMQEGELDRRSELEKGIALGKLARVYQDLGLKVEAGRTFDEALKIVKKVAQAERNSALGEEATYQMWDLYFASGDEEAAAEACSKLIRTFPDSPLADDALLIMGKAEEDPRKAIGHFSRLVKRYPDSPLAPEAQFHVAELKAERGHFDVAAFENCSNKFPGSNFAAKSLLKLAEYYMGQRDYKRAKDYLERITLDFPDFDQLDKTTYMRGVCAYRMGDVQLSYTLMHEVIEKYPGTSVAKSAAKIVKLLATKLNR
ncbi:MAG: tetratricopeptide repeat protein [Candidatus Brocadiia bacterium]